MSIQPISGPVPVLSVLNWLNPGFLSKICKVYFYSTVVLLSPQGGTGLTPGITPIDTGSDPVSYWLEHGTNTYQYQKMCTSVATPV